MRAAHLVHGFNVHDRGVGTVDKLIPYLNHFEIAEHDYGRFGFMQVRFCNATVAESVRGLTNEGDIGIGHSNGCAILAMAAEMGAPFAGLVFINPALDNDYVVSPQVGFVHVYHNLSDYLVWVAKMLRFDHPWGDMGRVGFTGKDERYRNINTYPIRGHSTIFKDDYMEVWGPKIARNVNEALPD